MKKKVLFVIHDLGQGGAEKVLVSLVNNMDRTKFDVSVCALFGGGVNEQFLEPDIHFRAVFSHEISGNSKLMKLLTPKQLYKLCVRKRYDIVVSYLEGPSARVVSGCPYHETKLVSWIHVEQHTKEWAVGSFRSFAEAEGCYNRFDRTICVSKYVLDDFNAIFKVTHLSEVLYNTVESRVIIEKSREAITEVYFNSGEIKLIGIGSLKETKGFDRLIRIHKRLCEAGLPVHTYILGKGPERDNLIKQTQDLDVSNTVTLLGYHTNPYKYIAKCDLFVCASYAEGFSTAATEALILGVPVCTVEVSGMKEMLGENNEYGIVVDNDDDALYNGIKRLLDDPDLLAHYKRQAEIRGKCFSTEETVRAVEDMLLKL